MLGDFTFISVVLDRSGSMAAVRDDVIGGFNEFLAQQKAVPGQALLTLAQFDNEYEVVHDAVDLKRVPDLDVKTYVPRGTTALHDALGRTICAVEARIARIAEPERPGRVIMLTLTDGHENASKEYDGSRIAALIKQKREELGWDFVFIGASQDAVETARRVNIPSGYAAAYSATPSGTRDVFATASQSLRSYRTRPRSKDFFADDS